MKEAKRKTTVNTALLLVDVQIDFTPPNGKLQVPHGDEVVAPLNQMIKLAHKLGWVVLASRDWHPKNSRHFAKFGGKWPEHCVQRTKGARFHPRLKIDKRVHIINKGRKRYDEGYSAFSMSTKKEESLKKFLKRNKITTLIIGGLATDYCVKATVLDAVKKMKGIKVQLLIDAIRAVNVTGKNKDEKAALKEMRKAGVKFTTTRKVINIYKRK